jgi:hypothetical protein
MTTDELNALIARIDEACEQADEQFWALIAKTFPEATSGDVDFSWPEMRGRNNRNMVALWLSWNAPSLDISDDDIECITEGDAR